MRAYRMWRVDFHGRLHPLFEWHWMFPDPAPNEYSPPYHCDVSQTWFSGYAKSNRTPTGDNTFGLWSLRDRKLLVENGVELYFNNLGRYWAWGEIEFAGHVVEGECGYRSERAAVRSISVVAPRWCRSYLRWQLSRRYDCPVTVGMP